MKKFKAIFRTPDKIFLEKEIEFFSFKAQSSSYGIMANHETVTLSIKGEICQIYYEYNLEPVKVAIIGGIVKFKDNTLTVLASFIELEENAKDAIDRREKQIANQNRRRRQSYNEFRNQYNALLKSIEETGKTKKEPID